VIQFHRASGRLRLLPSRTSRQPCSKPSEDSEPWTFRIPSQRIVRQTPRAHHACRVTDTAEGAREIATEIGAPVMVKAQVKVGGRGKAVASNTRPPRRRLRARKNILGLDIKGHVVKKLLVAEASDIARSTTSPSCSTGPTAPTWRCAR